MTSKKFFIAALAVSGALFGGFAHAGTSAGVEWVTPRGPLGLPLPPIPVPRIVVTPPAAVVVAPQHAPRDREYGYDERHDRRDDDRYDRHGRYDDRHDHRYDERWAYGHRHGHRRFVDRDRDGLDDRWERRQQWRRAQWQREQWHRDQWHREHYGR
jgi:hypothetical protein